MFTNLITAIAFGAFSMLALPQEDARTKYPPVEKLGPSVQFVTEKTLPFNNNAARLVASIPSEVSEMELTNPYVDESGVNSSSFIGRLKGRTGVSAVSFVQDVNAMRILAFMTQPGERVTFNLKSEQSKVRLAVYPDPKMTRVKAAVKRANMPPNAARSKKLIFTNTSKEPYEMLLFVYGLHGYEYSLSWEMETK